jgi:hypothetical protein
MIAYIDSPYLDPCGVLSDNESGLNCSDLGRLLDSAMLLLFDWLHH